MPLLRVSTCRPGELGGSELQRWNELQRDLGWANPFLSAAFAVAVDRCRPSTRVAVFEDRTGVIGFLPFDRGPLGIGRALAPGASDAQALVAAGPLDLSVPDLLRGAGLRALEFDHLLAGSPLADRVRGTRTASPVVDLSAGYQAYLAARRRHSFFKTAARKRRKLEREVGPLRFTFGAPDDAAVRAVLRWKSAQYRRTGRRDRLARPWVRSLVEQMLALDVPEATGVLGALYAGDRLVAGEVSLASSTTYSSWLPSYDVALAPYSPGSVLLLELLAGAAAAGIDEFDLGKGDEPYKASLETGQIPLLEGRLIGRHPVGIGWSLQRAARRQVLQFVLDSPSLRMRARRVLVGVGRVRGALPRSESKPDASPGSTTG